MYNGSRLALDEKAGTYFTRLTIAPMKARKRAREKVAHDYENDNRRLVDICRASIVVDDEDALGRVFEQLEAGSNATERFHVVKSKNRSVHI